MMDIKNPISKFCRIIKNCGLNYSYEKSGVNYWDDRQRIHFTIPTNRGNLFIDIGVGVLKHPVIKRDIRYNDFEYYIGKYDVFRYRRSREEFVRQGANSIKIERYNDGSVAIEWGEICTYEPDTQTAIAFGNLITTMREIHSLNFSKKEK